jgi:hypothetical protein
MTHNQATVDPHTDAAPRRWWRRLWPAVSAAAHGRSLAQQVVHAEDDLQWQGSPALMQVLSERELKAERDLAEWLRDEDRALRRHEFRRWVRARKRALTAAMEIEDTDKRDAVTARRARADARRESSQDARVARLYTAKTWSMRALVAVVVLAAVYSAVNVQRNVAPHGVTDPMFWLGFAVDVIITVPLVVIMRARSAIADGPDGDGTDQEEQFRLRRKLAVGEWALLVVTFVLNTYPYFDRIAGIGVHAVAPVMIGVLLALQDPIAALYGTAIKAAVAALPAVADADPQSDEITAALAPHRGQGHLTARTGSPQCDNDEEPGAGNTQNPFGPPAPDAVDAGRTWYGRLPQVPAPHGAQWGQTSPAQTMNSHYHSSAPAAPYFPHLPQYPVPEGHVAADADGSHPVVRADGSHPTKDTPPAPVPAAGPGLVPQREEDQPADADETRVLPAPTQALLAIAERMVQDKVVRKMADQVATVLAALEAGLSANAIEKHMGISYRTVHRIEEQAAAYRHDVVQEVGAEVLECVPSEQQSRSSGDAP